MQFIKSKVGAAVIAVVMLFTVVGAMPASAAPARPAVAATSATDCGQSAFLGTRVCVDKTTPYGPIAYIYTGAYSLYTTFSVSVAGFGIAFTATPYEYQVGRIDNGGTTLVTLTSYPLPGPPYAYIASYGNQNLMDWFANDPSYEFVVAN